MEVYRASTVVIEYDSSSKILFQNWSGFSSSEVFRKAIDKTVEFIKNNSVKAILNDTLAQNVVKPEDTEYASAQMPTLFQNGLKAMAIVVPQSIFTKMSLKKFEQESKGANLRMFTSKDEAKKWINGLS